MEKDKNVKERGKYGLKPEGAALNLLFTGGMKNFSLLLLLILSFILFSLKEEEALTLAVAAFWGISVKNQASE